MNVIDGNSPVCRWLTIHWQRVIMQPDAVTLEFIKILCNQSLTVQDKVYMRIFLSCCVIENTFSGVAAPVDEGYFFYE
jgi:hypothetical protein